MGFFDQVGSAVVNVVDAVVEAVTETAGAAADDGRDAAQEAEEGTRRVVGAVATAIGTAAREGARAAESVVDGVQRFVADVAGDVRRVREGLGGAAPGRAPRVDPYEERLLTQAERDLAWQVFEDSLPYGAIYLSNGLGFERRPYTIPHPAKLGSYVMHMGPVAFEDATDSTRNMVGGTVDGVFIHELTHVWQGHHYFTPFDYVVNSVFNQFVHGIARTDAYAFTAGLDWEEYNVEQQARIVETWYRNGRLESDTLFRYIRDHIRPGEP